MVGRPQPKRFKLVRDQDESGVSGTGVVAWGMEHPSGKCALIWDTDPSSVGAYDSITDIREIHGHNGKTRIVWLENWSADGD